MEMDRFEDADGSTSRPFQKAKGRPLHESKKAQKAKQLSRKKNLDLLPSMPLDVIFEILSFLAPRDIISMAKTNKLFRQTLVSSQASSVWRASREIVLGASCPSDFTEMDWVLLLYGNSCHSCGAAKTLTTDLKIRRRVCSSCRRNNLVAKSRFTVEFPGVDNSVLTLLPSTYYRSRGYTLYYWIPDIHNMLQKLASLEDNILRGLPNAKIDLEAYKKEQVNYVEMIRKDVIRIANWDNENMCHRIEEYFDRMRRRENKIIERMIELGHLEEDLATVKMHPQYSKKIELTDKIWEKIRPVLEERAREAMARRLAREKQSTLMTRRNMVDTLYVQYKASLAPHQWQYLPPTMEICRFECFNRLIDADPGIITVAEAHFTDCMNRLPELLATRLEATKSALRNEMYSEGHMAHEQSVGHSNDIMDTVAATFVCRQFCSKYVGSRDSSLVIGFDEVATHYCEPVEKGLTDSSVDDISTVPDEPIFIFHKKASDVAKDLACCAGLDVDASVSDMDAKDLRFKCPLCPGCSTTINRVQVTFATGFGWREAIWHSITGCHQSGHQEAPLRMTWEILSPEEKSKVVECENRDAKWTRHEWACSHCSMYLNHQANKDSVINHVQIMHDIWDPQDPRDFFFFERYRLAFYQRNIVYPIST